MTAKTVAARHACAEPRQRVADGHAQDVTKRAPTDDELRDLNFGFRVVKHVKTNTIIYAGLATVGIGAGQMSRVDAARIAVWKAQDAAATHIAGR